MSSPNPAVPPADAKPPVEHVAEAHALLSQLRAQLGQRPELEAAIEKLELALSALTIQTGGLL